MGYRDIARELVLSHEGLRLKPYKDSVGKLTIGVGRNLDDKGISNAEAMTMLQNDLSDAEADARSLVPSFVILSANRQAALIDMSLNMGKTRMAGFKDMLAAIDSANFEKAAAEMLDSDAARELPTRYGQLAVMMRAG
jgi:lysozyme